MSCGSCSCSCRDCHSKQGMLPGTSTNRQCTGCSKFHLHLKFLNNMHHVSGGQATVVKQQPSQPLTPVLCVALHLTVQPTNKVPAKNDWRVVFATLYRFHAAGQVFTFPSAAALCRRRQRSHTVSDMLAHANNFDKVQPI